jgi:predicted metalloprotease with PDZ domain
MRIPKLAFLLVAITPPAAAQVISKPQAPLPFVESIPAAKDIPFPGTVQLHVDATDTDRGIFRVTETIPAPAPGPMTLLYPKWLPGNHAPRGEVDKIVGLTIKAGGKTLVWKRDPVDVYAFHIDVPAGAKALDIAFQFASATEANQGRIVVTPEMLNLQWQSISLYPAGWFTRNIAVSPSVTYPPGWQAGTALRAKPGTTSRVAYETVSYETLVDSPVFAGKYFRKEDLGGGVSLNIVADAPEFLAATPEQIEAHRRLVSQATALFGTRQFDHYDFLLSLTDRMGGIGLEHHRSSENGVNPEYFTEWDSGPGRRNLLPHELTHSWNGKHRRPADLWTPDYRTPMRDSLLWVYEGQTQFWGYVLGARSGLFTAQETLDALATIAATLDIRKAREWRSLDDTNNDPIISARRPKGWASYQRSEDYYNEGMLIWLEADAIIRAESKGTRSLDDFARAFFGTGEGDYGVKTYDFAELTRSLNAVTPYDWAGFLTKRLTEKAAGAPLGGFTRSGYSLSYTEMPTPFFKDAEKRGKELNLSFSLGLTIGKAGKVETVIWGGPAFDAGITTAAEIVAINGVTYGDDVLKAAITAAKGTTAPIRLTIKTGERVRDVSVQWNGGLRYPRLVKTGAAETGLALLLRPR